MFIYNILNRFCCSFFLGVSAQITVSGIIPPYPPGETWDCRRISMISELQ